MSPITPEEAWNATDPSHTDEARQASASQIMAGVAANDAYINSRSELEQFVLRSQGPQIVAHSDLSEAAPETAGAIDGTAEEAGETPAVEAGEPGTDVVAPGDKQAEIDKLKAQITALEGSK